MSGYVVILTWIRRAKAAFFGQKRWFSNRFVVKTV